MIIFTNENILGLIFTSLQLPFINQQITLKINNNLLRKVILSKVLTYEKIFKSYKTTKSKQMNGYQLRFLTLIQGKVISITEDGTVKKYNTNNFEFTTTAVEPSPRSMALLSQGLMALSYRRYIRIYETRSYMCEKAIEVKKGHEKCMNLVSLSGGYFAFTAHCRKVTSIFIYDKDFNYSSHSTKEFKSLSPLIELPNYQLASGSDESGVFIWKLNQKTSKLYLEKVLIDHNGPVRSLLYIKRYNLLLSGSDDRTVRVWDLETYDCVKTLLHYEKVGLIALLPGGYFITGQRGGVIRLWDIASYKCVKILDNGASNFISIFLLGDYRLVSATDIAGICIWEY
jgi:WD40 repeat protein